MKIIELRSDTCSMPTDDMRKYMMTAEVGNDSWGEDPSVNMLVEKMKTLTGKEDCLLCCSGTMANLVAGMAHKALYGGFGFEVIMDKHSHSNWYEVCNLPTVAGVSVVPVVSSKDTYLDQKNLEEAVRPQSGHMTISRLLWLENTYMLGCGRPIPLDEMKRFRDFADAYDMSIHLDGARLLNASTALKVDPSEIVKYVDSVQMCLSKGVGAPFGSVLLGSKEFIATARRCKQAIGGGLRQAGFMAAAGIYGLDHYKENFEGMHRRAKRLAEGLHEIYPDCVNVEETQTNMVLFDSEPLGMTTQEFGAKLKEYGILTLMGVPSSNGPRVRMMTYPGIEDEDVERVIEVAKIIAEELKK